MTKSDRLGLRHGQVGCNNNIHRLNKYISSDKQPETRRCNNEDDTSREISLYFPLSSEFTEKPTDALRRGWAKPYGGLG